MHGYPHRCQLGAKAENVKCVAPNTNKGNQFWHPCLQLPSCWSWVRIPDGGTVRTRAALAGASLAGATGSRGAGGSGRGGWASSSGRAIAMALPLPLFPCHTGRQGNRGIFCCPSAPSCAQQLLDVSGHPGGGCEALRQGLEARDAPGLVLQLDQPRRIQLVHRVACSAAGGGRGSTCAGPRMRHANTATAYPCASFKCCIAQAHPPSGTFTLGDVFGNSWFWNYQTFLFQNQEVHPIKLHTPHSLTQPNPATPMLTQPHRATPTLTLERLHPGVPWEAQVAAQPPVGLNGGGAGDANVCQLHRAVGGVKQQPQGLQQSIRWSRGSGCTSVSQRRLRCTGGVKQQPQGLQQTHPGEGVGGGGIVCAGRPAKGCCPAHQPPPSAPAGAAHHQPAPPTQQARRTHHTRLDVAAQPHHIVCGVAEAAGVVKHLGSEVPCTQQAAAGSSRQQQAAAGSSRQQF